MAIIKNKKLDKSLEKEVYLELLKEFRKIDSLSGTEQFLNKFMTDGEKTLFLRRVAAMKLLERKKKYQYIRELLNISSGTISNINDILAGRGYGKNPNRKRRYSISVKSRKKIFKQFKRKYKGATNIIDVI